MTSNRIRVRFPGSLGAELVGQLELPQGEPIAARANPLLRAG